jgi:hypothetical protein
VAGLAHASGSTQREQVAIVPVELNTDLGDCPLPAREGSQLQWPIVRACVERLQRWDIVGQPWGRELADVLGLEIILESMSATVCKSDCNWDLSSSEDRRHLSPEDLPTMTGPEQPSDPVEDRER